MFSSPSVLVLVPVFTLSPHHYHILSPSPPHPHSSHPYPHTISAGLYLRPRLILATVNSTIVKCAVLPFTVSVSRFHVSTVRTHCYAYI